MIVRSVPVSEKQISLIEKLGEGAMIAGDFEHGTQLLALVLGWRSSQAELGDEPMNVVSLHGHSKKVPCR